MYFLKFFATFFGAFFASITSIHNNLETLLKNQVCLGLTLKMSFALFFMVIFVFSTSKYVFSTKSGV